MRKIWLIFTILLATKAHGASFDCAKASTPVERLICADRALSELDSALADVFSLELEREDAATRLRASQKAWLSHRNSCKDAACVGQAYEKRISELTCDSQSRMAGSAIGSNQCSHFTMRVLNTDLVVLEERYRQKIAAESDNPAHAKAVALSEQKAWRHYRSAQCALRGQIEGGSDGWKNAFAGMCEVNETQKRIARLKDELGAK